MKHSKRMIAGAAVALAALGIGAGVAQASGGGDDENTPAISGPALAETKAAALAHTGEGTVTETEVGDEESYYEVEVRLDDGRQVDVQLDRSFQVVGSSADEEQDN